MKQRKKFKEALAKDLYCAILKLETEKECKAFFKDLCTPSELQALADRWSVTQMLIKEIPYREISEKTGVSVTTVGRVSRFLFEGHNGYTTVLERLGKL